MNQRIWLSAAGFSVSNCSPSIRIVIRPGDTLPPVLDPLDSAPAQLAITIGRLLLWGPISAS